MLIDQIKAGISVSLKSGQQTRLSTLRMLLAAIRNYAIAKYQAAGESAVVDADVIEVVKKQAKTHRESIEAFTKGDRPELAKKEAEELVILEEFLPKQISDEELKALLAPVAALGEPNFGLLMKSAMAAVGGKAEGGRVSGLLKQMIQK